MSESIFYVSNQFGIMMTFPRTNFVKNLTNRADYFQICLFVVSAYVICLAGASLVINQINCAAVIFNPEPVPNILPCPINGDGFMSETFADNGGDKLLGILPGSIIV